MNAFIDPALHEEGWLISKLTPAERFLCHVLTDRSLSKSA